VRSDEFVQGGARRDRYGAGMRSISIALACAVAACSAASAEPKPTPAARRPAVQTDSNKQIVRRLFEDYFNHGRVEQLGEIVSPDFAGPNGQRGPASFAGVLVGLRRAFPDIVYTVEDLVGEGDRVAVRWTWRGTHTGPFRDWAPTGKRVTNTGFAIFQVADGKLTNSWLETDRLGFLLSIGVIPYDPAYGPPPATN
jgi:predicted ester cyclase